MGWCDCEVGKVVFMKSRGLRYGESGTLSQTPCGLACGRYTLQTSKKGS